MRKTLLLISLLSFSLSTFGSETRVSRVIRKLEKIQSVAKSKKMNHQQKNLILKHVLNDLKSISLSSSLPKQLESQSVSAIQSARSLTIERRYEELAGLSLKAQTMIKLYNKLN